MYRTIEERLADLEKTVEKQAFQIELLQSIAAQQNNNELYPKIVSSNMSKQCFDALKQITYDFERKVESGHAVALHEYIEAFEQTLKRDGVYLNSNALADLIPKWLGGSPSNAGFSISLHTYFYR